jgi:glycosyltransferase involved in cell wall biosynthesis
MKTLMLTPDYPPHSFGGIAGYVKDLSKNLVKLGVEVHIIVMRCDYFISDEYIYENDEGIHVYKFEKEKSKSKNSNFVNRWLQNSLTVLEQVHDIISDKNFDLIHTNDLFNSIIIDGIRDALQIPIINTIHGLSAPITLLEDVARRYGYFSSHVVITVSHSMARNLRKRYGDKENLKIIPLGINELSYNKVRQKTITFAGRLIEDSKRAF